MAKINSQAVTYPTYFLSPPVLNFFSYFSLLFIGPFSPGDGGYFLIRYYTPDLVFGRRIEIVAIRRDGHTGDGQLVVLVLQSRQFGRAIVQTVRYALTQFAAFRLHVLLQSERRNGIVSV
jgi:hypothetical protein